MSTLVLGAGVIGLATAHALHRAGHDVTVVEREAGPGLGTSFANAGGLCPGFSGPWAGPGVMGKALRWMVTGTGPLRIRPRPDPGQWRWLAAFARECDAARAAANKRAIQAVAHYARDCLAEIEAEAGLAFDQGRGGVLQVFRAEAEVEAASGTAAALREMGVPHRLLAPEEIAQVEPVLARAPARLAGALHLPGDGTGDAHLFCLRLREWLEGRGVRFLFDTPVRAVRLEGGRFAGFEGPDEPIPGALGVVAAGVWSADLLRRVGVRVLVRPVKGYSLTWEVAEGTPAPRSSIMDEGTKLMMTRLGSRLRVGGAAEVGGFERGLPPARLDAIRADIRSLLPEAAAGEGRAWAGLRPMTPDGRPRIGASRVPGLWLNLGHGSNGWTQAAGAGRLLADLVEGRAPAIDPAPYAPAA